MKRLVRKRAVASLFSLVLVIIAVISFIPIQALTALIEDEVDTIAAVEPADNDPAVDEPPPVEPPTNEPPVDEPPVTDTGDGADDTDTNGQDDTTDDSGDNDTGTPEESDPNVTLSEDGTIEYRLQLFPPSSSAKTGEWISVGFIAEESNLIGDGMSGSYMIVIELGAPIQDISIPANTTFDAENGTITYTFTISDSEPDLVSGWMRSREFRVILYPNATTENDTVANITATLYKADGTSVTTATPVKHTAIADVSWRDRAVNSTPATTTQVAETATVLPNTTFRYTLTPNLETTGREQTSKVVFKERIYLPEGAESATFLIRDNTTSLGGGRVALTNVQATVAGDPPSSGVGQWTITADSDTPGFAFDETSGRWYYDLEIEYTNTGSGEMPILNPQVIISGIDIGDETGDFIFTSTTSLNSDGTPNPSEAYGLVREDDSEQTKTEFGGAERTVTYNRPVPPPVEAPYNINPGVTKASATNSSDGSSNIAVPGNEFIPRSVGDTVTYTLSGFANVSGNPIDEVILRDTFIIDAATNAGIQKIALTGFTPGTYVWEGQTAAVAWDDLEIWYNTAADSTFTKLDQSSSLEITNIRTVEFRYGDNVPVGFTVDTPPTLVFKAVGSGTGVNEALTISNSAVFTYRDRDDADEKGGTVRTSNPATANVTYQDRSAATVGHNKTAERVRTTGNPGYVPGDEIIYTLQITNTNLVAMTNIEVYDYFQAWAFDGNPGNISASIGGTAVTLTSSVETGFTQRPSANPTWPEVTPESAPSTPAGRTFSRIVFKSQSGFILQPGETLNITYTLRLSPTFDGTSVSNKFWSRFALQLQTVGRGRGGGTGGTWQYVPPTLITGSSSGDRTVTVIPAFLNAGITKSILTPLPTAQSGIASRFQHGDIVEFQIVIQNRTTLSDNVNIISPVVADRLPIGMTYVPGSSTVVYHIANETHEKSIADPTIPTNPNPGPQSNLQQTLVWNLDGKTFKQGATADEGDRAVITFSARININIRNNNNTANFDAVNEAFLYPFPNNTTAQFTFDKGDSYATNSVGAGVTGYRIRATASVPVASTFGVGVRKHAAASMDGFMNQRGGTGTNLQGAKAGDEIFYRVDMFTSGATPVNVISFRDTLPANQTFVEVVGVYLGAATATTAREVTPGATSLPFSGVAENSGVVTMQIGEAGTGVKLTQNQAISVFLKVKINDDAPEMLTETNVAAFFISQNTTQAAVVGTRISGNNPTGYQNQCTVSYDATLVAPAIAKQAYVVSMGMQGEIWTPYQSGMMVNSGATIGWEVTVRNKNTVSTTMQNPLLLDLLPNNMQFVQGSLQQRVGTTWTDVSGETIENGILTYSLPDMIPGASLSFRYKTIDASGSFLGTIPNSAYLIPRESFNQSHVGSADGTVIVYPRDEASIFDRAQRIIENAEAGVKADVYVDVTGLARAAAVKRVAEADNPGNTAAAGGLIDVKNGNDVIYTLHVSNQGTAAFRNLVIIDRMPEVGDTGVRLSGRRESQYSMEWNGASVTASHNARIEYSNAVTFSAADWSGEGSGWSTDPEGARSFRVVFVDDVPGGQNREVTVRATVPETALNGRTAWNSFAYSFDAAALGNIRLTLEPPRAGVRAEDPKDGELTITKSFAGEFTEAPEGFNALFTLERFEDDIWLEVDSVYFQDFNNGNSHDFTTLERGTYRVTETEADIAGYTLLINSVEAVIGAAKEGGVTIEVENVYIPELREITITKIFDGDITAAPNGFNALFTLERNENNTWVEVDSVYFADFDNDNSHSFTDLDRGIYRVTETEADITGYILTTDATLVTGLTNFDDVVLQFTNTYTRVELPPLVHIEPAPEDPVLEDPSSEDPASEDPTTTDLTTTDTTTTDTTTTDTTTTDTTTTDTTPVAQIAMAPTPLAGLIDALTELLEGNVPLGNFGIGSGAAWSLLNLMMAITALFIMLLLFATLFKKKQNYYYHSDCEDHEKRTKHRERLNTLRIPALLMAMVPAILFLVLENIRLPVVWITRWTPLIGAFFIIQAILLLIFLVISKKVKYSEEDHTNDEIDKFVKKGMKH
ncbi:MAG: hypothetical protein FWE83_05035 [Oscillospiraceae bacterium]|nr:hypothetical protein [Oscillospiraceae bacterium]